MNPDLCPIQCAQSGACAAASYPPDSPKGRLNFLYPAFYLFVDNVEEMHNRAIEFGGIVEFDPQTCLMRTDNLELLTQAGIIGGFQATCKQRL